MLTSFITNGHELHRELIKVRQEKMKSIKAQIDAQRSMGEKIADFMTDYFGTATFFWINAVVFAVWIFFNLGIFPGIPVFDPYPFNFLTMTVSLEAIFLAVIVLMSQNRAARIGDLREEIDLQINVRAEEEITKMLIMLDQIHDHLGLPAKDDAELMKMKQKLSLDRIEKDLVKEMSK